MSDVPLVSGAISFARLQPAANALHATRRPNHANGLRDMMKTSCATGYRGPARTGDYSGGDMERSKELEGA
jgi:hypothetical protein